MKIPFDAKLRALRALHGLTQTELAERANINQWDVTQFERGLRPSLEKREALEAVFGVGFDDPRIDEAFRILAGERELVLVV